jgi:SAM-dependent methyltransferase
MTPEEQSERWGEVLDTLTGVLPPTASVVVDGPDPDAAAVADRLAGRLRRAGRPYARELSDPEALVLADGPAARAERDWDVVIWLRTAVTDGRGDGEYGADIVLDLHDPAWPVIRRVADRLGGSAGWYLTESRAFFATRAASWDTRFGDDLPAYAAAVAETGIAPGAAVLDAGCGTGRALPALRAAVGETGTVVGLDLTPQMLAEARRQGRGEAAALLMADARRLPFADGSLDAVFAAGLVTHLPDLCAGLAELARVTRPGGRLTIFHPSGRAALAARHGRTLRPDDPLHERRLASELASTGWTLSRYDDPPERFFALATR